MGRFISQDPVGFGGGDVNLYRYAGNGAVNFVDPSGMNGKDLGQLADLITQEALRPLFESLNPVTKDTAIGGISGFVGGAVKGCLIGVRLIPLNPIAGCIGIGIFVGICCGGFFGAYFSRIDGSSV